jgi:hypothetical protein
MNSIEKFSQIKDRHLFKLSLFEFWPIREKKMINYFHNIAVTRMKNDHLHILCLITYKI